MFKSRSPPQPGSSPRLRGTSSFIGEKQRNTGIIPALAGNIRWICLSHWTVRDHPRACGEHQPFAYRDTLNMGSSPRLRGTCTILSLFLLMSGIIPALAGNIQ